MKTLLLSICLSGFLIAKSQGPITENIFIITTDGFRWQEVFNGADANLIRNTNYVQDTVLMGQLFWDDDQSERRKKLMPFFWNVIAKQGQIYGNRQFDNKVNVRNRYKISYPGYNEILTGYADPFPVFNTPTYNKNVSLLEYLNKKAEFTGKVAAFSSWNIFPFILNNKRSSFSFNYGYQKMEEELTDSAKVINAVQESIMNKTNTRHDLLTCLVAREYIQQHHPRLVFISLGQTDDYAHQGRYDMYLQQASGVDKMVAELWYFVQTDSVYRNKTSFIITTDHGRGDNFASWTRHGIFTKGSGEAWVAMIGSGIEPAGELEIRQQIYLSQLASTMARMLGEKFIPLKKTGKPFQLARPLLNTALVFPAGKQGSSE